MNNKDNDDDDDDEEEEEEDDMINNDGAEEMSQALIQCPACQRRMRQEIFSKHPNVCRANPTKTRNIHVFDMTQYRSIRSGDKVLPVRKLSPINTNKPTNNNNIRPSQTRSAKRDRRSDAVVPPIINNFCM
jgi:hypothetical protein